MKNFLSLLTILFLCVIDTANASNLADIKSKIAKDASELAEVDKLLSASNPNARIAAMEALIASGNLTFRKRAVETGLLSSDLEMRRAALFAIFQNQGPFRLQLDLSKAPNKETVGKRLIETWNGSWNPDETLGSITFTTLPYNSELKCWPFKNETCAIILNGETISIQGWYRVSGTLTLNNTGQLVGQARYTSGTHKAIPATIDLLEQ